jgi:hypothetical protein
MEHKCPTIGPTCSLASLLVGESWLRSRHELTRHIVRNAPPDWQGTFQLRYRNADVRPEHPEEFVHIPMHHELQGTAVRIRYDAAQEFELLLIEAACIDGRKIYTPLHQPLVFPSGTQHSLSMHERLAALRT